MNKRQRKKHMRKHDLFYSMDALNKLVKEHNARELAIMFFHNARSSMFMYSMMKRSLLRKKT